MVLSSAGKTQDKSSGILREALCSPETITTLLIGHIPIQNVLVLKKIKLKKIKMLKEERSWKS